MLLQRAAHPAGPPADGQLTVRFLDWVFSRGEVARLRRANAELGATLAQELARRLEDGAGRRREGINGNVAACHFPSSVVYLEREASGHPPHFVTRGGRRYRRTIEADGYVYLQVKP